MVRIFLYILCFLLLFEEAYSKDQTFNITIIIKKPISISVEREFNFGMHEQKKTAFTVTIGPDDEGCAVFNIAGSSNSSVSYTVAEDFVNLSNGSDTIKVGGFKVTGGSKTGVGNLAEGELKSIGVGATAYIEANQPDTAYYGNATFRAIYN